MTNSTSLSRWALAALAASSLLAAVDAQSCGSPMDPPYQVNEDQCAPTIYVHRLGGPGLSLFYIGSASPAAPVVLKFSPSLAPSPTFGPAGGYWLSGTGSFRVGSPTWKTGSQNYLLLGPGYPVVQTLYCQALVGSGAGARLTPVRILSSDYACYFYDTFNTPANTAAWWQQWANGYSSTNGVGTPCPAASGVGIGVAKLSAAQGTSGNPACNAGGLAMNFKDEIGHGFHLNGWFAVDNTPYASWYTCQNFRFKALLTPGMTTSQARTLFMVMHDYELVVFDKDGTAINTGVYLGSVDSSGNGSNWYRMDIEYAQITPGTTNLGFYRVLIRDCSSLVTLFDSGAQTWQPVTLSGIPNGGTECALTHLMFEAGGPPAFVDEISLQD